MAPNVKFFSELGPIWASYADAISSYSNDRKLMKLIRKHHWSMGKKSTIDFCRKNNLGRGHGLK